MIRKTKHNQQVQDYFDRYYSRHCFIVIHSYNIRKSAEIEWLVRFSFACRDKQCDLIIVDEHLVVTPGQVLHGISLSQFPIEEYITVISLHPKHIKTTAHRTLLTCWLPVTHMIPFLDGLTTFDGYLSGYSFVIDKFIQSVTVEDKDYYGYLSPSVPKSSLLPIRRNWKNLRIFYCSTKYWNTRTNSFQSIRNDTLELVKALDEHGWTKIYGPRNQYQTDDVLTWYGFRTYFGELPFDGVSVIREIADCGLCLVSPSVHQNRSEICSMQLFDAIAAGVPILCTPNPFIEWWFRDNVFVIHGDNVEQRTACVQQHMDYIVDNPMEVHEKMSNCRRIFNDYFSLDGQIDRFLQYIPPSGGGGVSIRPNSPPTPTRLPPSPPSSLPSS